MPHPSDRASQPTPGPWIWGDDYRGLYGAGPDNEVLCYAGYEGMWLTHGPAREANALLLAAAPDLLEACVAYIADREEAGCTMESASVKRMRAAIARATGAHHG
jgi:hypothetical protein